jgi:hypothetical protein
MKPSQKSCVCDVKLQEELSPPGRCHLHTDSDVKLQEVPLDVVTYTLTPPLDDDSS